VGLVESGNFQKGWVVAWRFVEPRENLLVAQKPEAGVSMVGHSAFGQTDSELAAAGNKLCSGCCNEYQCSKSDPENAAKLYLFVCGLNLVGCPSSIELKKSRTSLFPCLAILTSEDEGPPFPSWVVLAKETLGVVITFPFGWDEVVAALMTMFN